MQRFAKTILIISIFCLSFWVLEAIFQPIVQIELTSKHAQFIFEISRFIGVPLAIFICVVASIRRVDQIRIKAGKIALAIGAAFISFIIMSFILFQSIQTGIIDTTVFIKRETAGVRIIDRHYGYDMMDHHKQFQVKNITKFFTMVTNIDTNKMDKAQWSRVKITKD